MKNYWKKFVKDPEAVSPVIGVILMVAITVILAAIIAAFVLGLGAGPGITPQARIRLTDATSAAICLEHQGGSQGGENLSLANVRLTVAGTVDSTPGWVEADGAGIPNSGCASLTASGCFRTGEKIQASTVTVAASNAIVLSDTVTGGIIATVTAPTVLSGTLTCA